MHLLIRVHVSDYQPADTCKAAQCCCSCTTQCRSPGPVPDTCSVDDNMVPADAAAAQAAAKARAVLRKQRPPAHEPWWPPVEFSALVGLCVAVLLSGLTNLFLCKPVLLSQLVRGNPKVMKECASCCATPAAQASHLVLMQRQPQRVLQPLPLPLRQYLDLDQLPAPTYKVPSLVVLPERTKDGVTASLVAAQEWLHSRVAYQLQQLASANVSTKVLALWLLSMPFIALAAALYQKAAAITFKEAMYKVCSQFVVQRTAQTRPPQPSLVLQDTRRLHVPRFQVATSLRYGQPSVIVESPMGCCPAGVCTAHEGAWHRHRQGEQHKCVTDCSRTVTCSECFACYCRVLLGPAAHMSCACTLTQASCSFVQVPILLQIWCFWRVSSRLQPSLVRAKGWKHQHAKEALVWRASRALHSRAAGSLKAPSSRTAAATIS